MSEAPDTPEDDDALASEYVLSLLDSDEAREVERRAATDSAFMAKIRLWEARLAPLAENIAEVRPPAFLKARVMKAVTTPEQHGLRKRFSQWVVPALIAACVGVLVLWNMVLRGPDFEPAYHASLLTSDGGLQIEAGYAPDSSLFKVLRPQGDPRPNRALELWLIPEGADAPVSLGVLPDARETLFELTPELGRLIAGGTLAVSDEPRGGSPTGAPTGAILATGAFFGV